ncbi:MAG: glycosyltransferase family 2 protein [Candidatus Omnitrophica bacterium]|nr:glycosyltransferase family 2 protein [Candidatus Omnitrophota bacterium]
MTSYDVTCAIVVYNNEPRIMLRAAQSFLNTSLKVRLYIVDNSPDNRLQGVVTGPNVEYVCNGVNRGFGAAHNQIIDKVLGKSRYHLIMNPDVYFTPGVVEKLFDHMEDHRDTGCVLPKVFYPDGSIQYLCKLLPTPLTLFARRFMPFCLRALSDKASFRYEMRFTGYDRMMEVPYSSGAFMFLRNEAIAQAGKFDERFFMYLEDVDFSRRMNEHYKNVYLPEVCIFHDHVRGSYKNIALLSRHIVSAVRYFNKWGWFFDRVRTSVNKRAREQFGLF